MTPTAGQGSGREILPAWFATDLAFVTRSDGSRRDHAGSLPPGTSAWEDTMASLNVNGQSVEVEADESTPLLWVIREQLGLTGTKYGCGVAQCGACTVHIDGTATRSCVLPLAAVEPGQKIVTIEGLSPDGSHPVQRAWLELDVPQCGYCQTGMIMAAAALLEQKPSPTDADIDSEITNICRCGTYGRVRRAIKLAAGNDDAVRQG
jgi:isoquinoline 1-oxidoreductase alpha subunit